MSKRRVVITGLGWVTSLGLSVDQVWDKLCQGRSGVGQITLFDTSQHGSTIGGEVADWTAPHIPKREAKRLDRFAQFAVNAAIDAVNDAGLDFSRENVSRCGSIVGSGIGGIAEFEAGHRKMIEKGPDRVSPFMIPKLMCNASAANISIYFGLTGPNSAVVTACASGAHAIADAADAIRHDTADVMVAGGSEAAVTPLGLACFVALKALSCRNDDPERASRPWDRDRDGFVLSEGAGIVVLEEYERARRRGARIHGELLGAGRSADGTHITAPDEQGGGAALAMAAALKDAQINATDVDYVNAHGTSTQLGDLAETRGIKRLFGDHAHKLAVSSTKSMMGHLLGASGSVEGIIATKAVQTGVLPPTINLDNPSEDCDLDYIPNTARQTDAKIALNNSFGFGGHNACLAIGRI